jgi:hypothetical protein
MGEHDKSSALRIELPAHTYRNLHLLQVPQFGERREGLNLRFSVIESLYTLPAEKL